MKNGKSTKQIEGVARLQWGKGQQNTFIGALTAAMRAMEENITYEYLMGISSAAFRLHFQWCPSSPDATCGFDHSVPALKALGYTAKGIHSDKNKPEDVKKVREAVVKSIDSGFPVLAIDLINVPDWGLIVGYANGGEEFLCRTYYDKTEEYSKAEKWPWVTVFVEKKDEKPSRRESLMKSLEIAVEISNKEKYGDYASGFAAYETWIKELLDDSKFDKLNEEELNGRIHTNAWCYDSLVDARESAVKYLQDIKDEFNEDSATHLAKASEIYQEIVKKLHENWKYALFPWQLKDGKKWTKEMRHAEADALNEVLALEKKAIGELKAAVDFAKKEKVYGFRYEPMKFVKNDHSLQGAMIRTFVFNSPLDTDKQILQKKINEILAKQQDDGSFGDETSKETGSKLLELFKLGCSADKPEVKRAAEAILRQKRAGQNANEWYEVDSALNIYPLHALCLAGMSDVPEVSFTLKWLIEHTDAWLGHEQGCPWTPAVFLKAVWEGREIEDVDDTITKGFRGIADNLNDAGCLGSNEPWGYLDCAGYVNHPVARKIVEKQIPMILRAQKPDGGWGEHSFVVFRALVKYNLLEELQGLPPLPSDWNTVRTIPAPDGELFTMTWDGQRLWVRDKKENEVIAISPQDGKVLKKVKLPVEKVFGIGWWDDALAVTQTEPKRLLKIDPDTGEIKTEISLDDMEWVHGITQVEGKIVIGDGFMCSTRVLDLANPSERRWQTLAGPGPISLTSDGNAVWHFDFWAPAIIKSDINGKLLDWGEKPFDGSVDGLAWDGERLWALDNKQKQICVIEKSQTGMRVREEEHKENAKVVLDGVDSYRVIEPMFEGVRVILSYRGEKYSPAYIQGISGAAFRIAGICPCAPTCSYAMNPQDLVKLLGYEVEYLPLYDENIDLEKEASEVVKRVKDEIRSGRPALVWHAFTTAEWDVVCGFDDEKRQFIGRGSYKGSEDYAVEDETRTAKCGHICPPQGAILIGEKTGTFDARKAELTALREAVKHAHSDRTNLLEGLAAYDNWISEFKSNPEKIRDSGDAYCYGIYKSTHRAASEFLKEIAPKYPKATQHLENAAKQFAAEADVLDQGTELLSWQSPEGPDLERNAKIAELLTKARNNYANGIKEIKLALQAIDAEETVKIKKLNNLEFIPRATSHMGALKGCLNYLGIDVSPGWLYGSTGHAFVMGIGSDLCGSGPHCWSWGNINKLGKNIGYKTEDIYTNKSKEDFSQVQEKAWDFVRKSIDDGFPCYGWHYDFMVINGYDDNGYLLSGPVDDAPRDWRKFGAEAVGFLDIWSIRPGQKADDMTTIKDALFFAVDLAKEPDKWIHEGIGSLSAYGNWIEGLESGEGDAFGAAYHAGIWAECRRYAVEFLEEANQRTGKKYDILFQPAIKQYKLVSENLNKIEKLFPYKDATEEQWEQNMEDSERRQKAVELLKAAKEAEALGLKALENILAKLKMEP